MPIEEIKAKIKKGEFRFSEHAAKRMIKRSIDRYEIEDVVIIGEIIEEYLDDKYSPSCLIYGKTRHGGNLHVQLSYPPSIVIITTKVLLKKAEIVMRVGLIGFGKTGKPVATTILRNKDIILEWVVRKSELLEHRSVPEFLGEYSNEPGLIYSSKHTNIADLLNERPVDIIIDFSSETGIHYYGKEAAKRKIKIISAISHYADKTIKLLKKYSKSTTVFWSPNITIGVNYLMIVANFLKKIAPKIDVVIVEEHFKDKPGISGTAKIIAENLEIDPLEIKSIRAGGIIGRHEIICGFPFQTIRLIHESITREAFGNGVTFVAENLINKKEGFYTFEELLLPYFAI